MKTSSALKITLISAGLGVVLGILLAPDKGSNTVNKVAGMISDNLQKLKDYVDDFAASLPGDLPTADEMSFAKQSDVVDG